MTQPIPMKHQRNAFGHAIDTSMVRELKEPPKIEDLSLRPSKVSKMDFVNFKRALKNQKFMRV